MSDIREWLRKRAYEVGDSETALMYLRAGDEIDRLRAKLATPDYFYDPQECATAPIIGATGKRYGNGSMASRKFAA
jgi:hypothetical protein